MPVAAPIAGGIAAGATSSLLANKGGGSSGNTTTIQQADPWVGVQPSLRNLFAQGNQYAFGPFNAQSYLAANPDVAAAGINPYQHYLNFGISEGRQGSGMSSTPLSYLAPQSSDTLQAQDLIRSRAMDPNSLIAQSQGVLGNTIAGKYLSPDSNPFLKSAVQDALGLAGAAFSKQYGGAAGQGLDNTGYQEALARGLGSAATNAYSSAYQNERQNQLNAMQLAPQMDYANLSILQGLGASEDARKQAEIDAPFQTLQRYQALISGQPGGTTSTQSPYFTNPFANAMGMGLGGLALYRGLGGTGSLFGGGSASGGGTSPFSGQPLGQPDFSAGYY